MSPFDSEVFDEHSTALQREFLAKFKSVDAVFAKLEYGREAALALTKLEEAYMWVGKAIKHNQLCRKESPDRELFKAQLGGV